VGRFKILVMTTDTKTGEMKQLVSPNSVGNKKIKTKADALAKIITENAEKRFVVCVHNNPDPDALSSGLGMMRILNFYGIHTDKIYYSGEISHPQNRAMQVALNLPVKQWNDTIEKELAAEQDDCVFIYLDVCGPEQKNMSIPFQPTVVIDHHKSIPKDREVLFIHDEIGACATLVVDLILNMPPIREEESMFYCFDHEADGMRELCTALAIGIKTDTVDFVNETSSDYDYKAYKIVTNFMLTDKFHKIVNYELPPYIFEYERVAWENKKFNAPNFISGLGFIDDSRSDCIPHIADKMMRLQGVQTVVIYAIVDDRIRASVRSTSASYDCEELVASIFGIGNGGAKQGIGGAAVSLGLFEDVACSDDSCEDRQKLWDLVKSQIEKKFTKVVSK